MFGYFKPKLVEFGNGKFSILKRNFMGPNFYLGRDIRWWCHPDYIEEYCFYETPEIALQVYDQYLVDEAMKKVKFKSKVISTLDDEWDL